jgi:hypothetical protein
MPVVRGYNRQVTPQAAPAVERTTVPGVQVQTPQLNVRTSPDQFGAQFGETVSRIGFQMLEAQRVKADEARLDSEERALQEWELSNLYDPQKGAFSKRGSDALNLGQTVEHDFDQFVSERRQTLGNERLKTAYDSMTLRRRGQILVNTFRHEAAETEKFQIGELVAGLSNHQSLAALNAGDPVRVSDELQGVRESAARLAQMNRLGPEATQQLIDAKASEAHRGVIDQLAKQGYQKAALYYQANEKEIIGADREHVSQVLKESTLRGESQQVSDAIWRERKPESFSEIDSLVQDIADPDVRDNVQSRLQSRLRAQQQDETDARQARGAEAKAQIDAAMQGLLNAIDSGHPRDMVGVHRLVDKVAPGLWTQLDEKQRNALESYAGKLQEGSGTIKTDTPFWIRLRQQASTNPQEFLKQDPLQWLSKLSPSDVQEMVKLQDSIRKGDEKEANKALDDFRTERQVIDNTLSTMGINPSLKENDATVARVHQIVGEQAGAFSRLTGKKPNNDDLQRIVDSVVKTNYTVKGWIWDSEKPLVGVTIADIPSKDRAQIEDALRKANQAVSDNAILDLFIRTQQRLKKK